MARGNGTYHPSEIAYWDKSQETGRFEVFTAVVTATSTDDVCENFASQSTLWSALVTKAQGMVLGLVRSTRWVNEVIVNANPDKSDINQGALREVKLQLKYIDNTTQKAYTVTLPTLDTSKVTYLPLVGDDSVALDTPTAMADFVAAFEAVVVAPDTGNPVTIREASVVGRNV